jgi:hypothetical protein
LTRRVTHGRLYVVVCQSDTGPWASANPSRVQVPIDDKLRSPSVLSWDSIKHVEHVMSVEPTSFSTHMWSRAPHIVCVALALWQMCANLLDISMDAWLMA